MISLSEPAEYLLESLTWKVRGLTQDQIARVYRARFNYAPNLRVHLDRLRVAGLLRSSVAALLLLEPLDPLNRWSPGDEPIDVARTCWELEQRWRAAATRRVRIYWATEQAARHFAGVADFARHPSQVEHDLGTSAVFARLHEVRPAATTSWVGEMILRRDHLRSAPWLKKLPDAAIFAAGHVVEFVEFGGQYKPRQLRRLQSHCQRFAIPYSLW